MISTLKRRFIVLLALPLFLPVEPVSLVLTGSPTTEAAARIGRPATPVSVAGVARRTTRRCVTGVYYC
jgi:hypothetical protein